MTAPRDKFGRPIVVVTGMGVITSLGAGKADNWAKLTAGESGIRTLSRFPIEGLKTTMAGTIDFIPVEPFSSVGLSERLAVLAMEEAIGQAGIGGKGDFPGPLFLAVPPVEIEWPQREELGQGLRHHRLQLRRSAGRMRRRQVRDLSPPLPDGLRRRLSRGHVRHQGIADLAVDGLRLGRYRDTARGRGDPARRNRCRPLRGDRGLGQPGRPGALFAACRRCRPRTSRRRRPRNRSRRTATALSWRKVQAPSCSKAMRRRLRGELRSSA